MVVVALRLVTTVLFLAILAACRIANDQLRVVGVVDGDTIIVEGGLVVRYIGIDAPEKNEALYLQAQKANEELVRGKRVRLEKDISDKDSHGRLLRYVYLDGIFVNAELVRAGLADAKAYLPDVKYQAYLEAVEKEARQTRRGLWSQQ
ncbi:MAG: thermonuclease family protein [Chloroflexi bacterium]|nr:thermonuclease family protein [Chloroflexota bacterium]MBM3174140.1 thermonuclease family protein [Chloroflexota bacterium]MBM4449208.1 thermonuclease family protein [Chloroflexota bacterium]